LSFLKHSIVIKKIPKTAIATETPNHIRFDPVICVKSLHGGVVYPLNFISKFVSKNINNLRCESKKYDTSRTCFMFCKNPQTIANTRKTRNHNGYGFSFSLPPVPNRDTFLFLVGGFVTLRQSLYLTPLRFSISL